MSPSAPLSEDKAQNLAPGLERSCTGDWVRAAPWQAGIHRIEAFFAGAAYAPHRHDTYSIGYTIKGVQSFDYRGARTNSLRGQVMVLHPDEVHNGEAGSEAGFHYRMIYMEPALVRDALGASARALPFVKQAVFNDARLLRAVDVACSNLHSTLDPICLDEIITLLADGLLAKDPTAHGSTSALIDARATGLARDFLEANLDRVVASEELEAIAGLNRYALSRDFRRAYGTSPYRYLTMRRLDRVRKEIAQGAGLAEAALATGFSDQAHMSRQFKASYGLSPGRWQQLAHRS